MLTTNYLTLCMSIEQRQNIILEITYIQLLLFSQIIIDVQNINLVLYYLHSFEVSYGVAAYHRNSLVCLFFLICKKE
jgi:hypothetical protein